MNTKKKLKKIIEEKILSIIDNNYIFLDIPYYSNIGDALIWKGTKELLKKTKYKCLYTSSLKTYNKKKISKKDIILIQGGGNFGDLWRVHTEFIIKIINDFPKNKIIILPKSAFYENKNLINQDVEILAKHNKLIICARDNNTYKLFKKYFYKNKILLIPDMAFCIPQSFLNKHKRKKQNKTLFLKRNDKELKNNNYIKNIKYTDEFDWPTMNNKANNDKIFYFLNKIKLKFSNYEFINIFINKIINLYITQIYLPYLVKTGIRFLSIYKKIYTNRLHGAILAILTNKKTTILDNSYGKNKSFYETWLTETNNTALKK